ncbi:hypothetical protein GALL_513460 [mine drainage metagenome]|uniref:Uncharacterized protein n=1 Tax=mine drainage metagenome TaxID=410659 RepID=A0A1J5PH16_9ZZZZ
MLDGQPGQINILAFPHHVLARRTAQFLGRHAPQGFHQTAHADEILEAFGRFGFFQAGQYLTKLAQFAHIANAHAQGHAPGGAKQVAQHRYVVAAGVLKQQRRATGTKRAVAQGGHFQIR